MKLFYISILLLLIALSTCAKLNLNLLSQTYNKFIFETPYCKSFTLYLNKCDSDICGGGCGMIKTNSTDSINTDTFNFNLYNDNHCSSEEGTTSFTCNTGGSPVIISPFKIYCKSQTQL